MFKSLFRKFTAIRTAAQAGLIVSRCERENPLLHCRLDDEEQCVVACFRHAAEIERLSIANEEC